MIGDFVKYHAAGNDYLVLDPDVFDFEPTPEHVRLVCDRNFGIGADGVLIGPIGPISPDRPIELRLANSDGTECGRSGNGIRIFALYLTEHYPVGSSFVVRTQAGETAVEVLDPVAGLVSVGMGRPDFSAAAVPVLGLADPVLRRPLTVAGTTLQVSCLNNGNPHTVVLVDEPSRELAYQLGPQLAGHPAFPQRTNVQLAQVLDTHTVRIEIWERGAGYTLSSGSSGCAAAAALHALGLVADRVRVLMPGGDLDLAFDSTGAITMTGTAELVAAGSFGPRLRDRIVRPLARGLAHPAPAGTGS